MRYNVVECVYWAQKFLFSPLISRNSCCPAQEDEAFYIDWKDCWGAKIGRSNPICIPVEIQSWSPWTSKGVHLHGVFGLAHLCKSLPPSQGLNIPHKQCFLILLQQIVFFSSDHLIIFPLLSVELPCPRQFLWKHKVKLCSRAGKWNSKKSAKTCDTAVICSHNDTFLLFSLRGF